MSFSRTLLLRLLLVFALLGGQMAGFAHALGHVAEWGASSQSQEPDKKSAGHVCLECLALSALDLPLAPGQPPVPVVAASLLPAAEPLPLGWSRHYFHAPIRAPPVLL